MQRWIAILVVGTWLFQIFNLWPLPSRTGDEMLISFGEGKIDSVTEMVSIMWFSFVVRLLLIPFGILSGVLLYRQNSKWILIYLVSSFSYLLIFRVWQWAPFYLKLFESENILWIVEKPLFLFNTFLFPFILIVIGAYATVPLNRKNTLTI